MAKDSIEMKADLSDFITAQGKLQTQENKLIDILGRYSNLKKELLSLSRKMILDLVRCRK